MLERPLASGPTPGAVKVSWTVTTVRSAASPVMMRLTEPLPGMVTAGAAGVAPVRTTVTEIVPAGTRLYSETPLYSSWMASGSAGEVTRSVPPGEASTTRR